MYDNSHPKQPETAEPREADLANESRNLVPNSMSLDCNFTLQNREVNKSKNEAIKKVVQELRANKQRRQEVSKKTGRNRDLVRETSSATNRMPSVSSRHSPPSFNDRQQQVDIRKALLNNESQWNIGQFHGSQKDAAPVKSSDSSKSVGEGLHSKYDISAVPGPSGFHGNQSEPKNESQWNIDQFQGSQKAHVKSDSHDLVGKGEHSKDDISAIPGPSGFHGNQSEPNMLVEESESSSTSEIPKVVPRRIITCKICGEDTHKHTRIKSVTYYYFCCGCKYETIKSPNSLQKHVRIHCSKNDCNVCLKEYTEGPLHVGLEKCQLCVKTFNCRTQRDEHRLLDHEKHFIENCWECCLPTISHYTRIVGKKLYFCCMCGYETNICRDIQIHNENHRPKIFCKICREEYPEEENSFHNSKCFCMNCNKEFECRTQLEDHYKGDPPCVKHFSKSCRLCNRKINNHVVYREGKQYFKCCACPELLEKSTLRYHLPTHPGLRIFKCDTCGKRLRLRSSLRSHSKTCIPSPFPCEICRARFPSIDSVNKHCLEKHIQTR